MCRRQRRLRMTSERARMSSTLMLVWQVAEEEAERVVGEEGAVGEERRRQPNDPDRALRCP